MMERRRRLILFLAATALTATFVFKGHAPSRQDGNVAFLPWTSSGVTVRVKGDVQVQGVLTFPRGAVLADVINLTVLAPASLTADKPLLATLLRSGDVVQVTGENPLHPVISVNRMKAGERMVLDIPLHPDQMDVEDWESLPGIGPELAKKLVVNRQNNGDYFSLGAIRRVPGMGEKKVGMIRKYFDH